MKWQVMVPAFAHMVDKDILIIPVHRRDTCSGSIGDYPDFTWIKGNYWEKISKIGWRWLENPILMKTQSSA